ncbi:nuclease-related domain-containing DEAD/DEAH box helicase [Janthinobacterium agaricidamnosum]|nr:NERD domain-containing protein/DEAD/DEAH box helicase [Janthinobacterium agaricidamnosum]
MAVFLPELKDACFKSEGEYKLFNTLAALDDEFTVVHSCPWLRPSVNRIFSQTKHRYINLFRNNKKNLTGETDFVITHPKYGILCIEVKTGDYHPLGARFVHAKDRHIIDPLDQVKKNAFTTIDLLEQKQISCPVGYAVYICNSQLDTPDFASAYFPIGETQLQEGIILLPKHEQRIQERILELFEFWRTALSPAKQDFADVIERFIATVWPKEIIDNELARKISFDNEVWLKLDQNQHHIVKRCLKNNSWITAGFAGTGKTVIAYAVATAYAAAGKRVAFLFKNKKIASHIAEQVNTAPNGDRIMVSTFHAYCDKYSRDDLTERHAFDDYHKYLMSSVDTIYDCLIVDEAQGLSETDHAALVRHFQHAKKYIFADRYQVFSPMEKGVDYSYLEATYGVEAYYLHAVYRNPWSVTEKILEILPVNHEIINQRTDRNMALNQYFVKNVEVSLKNQIKNLKSAGAKAQDIVVLSQFSVDFIIPGVEVTTIAAFRGMEAPIVIILGDVDMDGNTLACALGRCTTRAIVLWHQAQCFTDPAHIRLDYLKDELEHCRPKLIEKDFNEREPVYIANIIKKYAGKSQSYDVAGCTFSFSEAWRGWLTDTQSWPNSEAQLWGILLKILTNTRFYSIEQAQNRLAYAVRPKYCNACARMTPHPFLQSCIPCSSVALNADAIRQAYDLLEGKEVTLSAPLTSIRNVAAKIAGTNQLFDPRASVENNGRELELLLGSILVIFNGRREGSEITRQSIAGWIEECIVPQDFGTSIDDIVGRVITSLCARKIFKKIADKTYALTS